MIYTERIKVTIVRNSNVDYMLNRLSERFFGLKGKGNLSAALRWCVEYGLARQENEQMLTDMWVDLPPGRIQEVHKFQHGIATRSYTIPLNVSDILKLDALAKEKDTMTTRKGNTVEIPLHSKFNGMRRNVIVQCVQVVLADVLDYVITTNKSFDSLSALEDHYKVSTSMRLYSETISSLDNVILRYVALKGHVSYSFLQDVLPIGGNDFMPIVSRLIDEGVLVKRVETYEDIHGFEHKETRYVMKEALR